MEEEIIDAASAFEAERPPEISIEPPLELPPAIFMEPPLKLPSTVSTLVRPSPDEVTCNERTNVIV